MHKFKLKQISLAICLAAMPFAANAAGLGKLTVVSGLGEPLSAEIELLSTTPEELSSLTAAIAPEEAYNVQGVERTSIHGAIKIDVSKKSDGTPILKLTTRQPVNDPFLDMLIQVDWSTGRLLREYTVLLDPPGYADQAPVNTSPATTTSIGGTESDLSKLPPMQQEMPLAGDTDSRSGMSSGKKKSAGRKSSGSKPAQVVAESGEAGDTSGTEHTTVRGDTLSAIATQNKIEGVSLDQMLVGLYRANKDAFDGANMNRLKVGQIIRMPSADELQATSRAEASQEVKVQTADWQAYRNKLAGIVAESMPASEESGNQAAGGKITTPAEDKAAPAQTGPRDVVKLSKSDNAIDAKAGSAKAMQEKLSSLQEEVTAREKGLKEADERTAMLEKQIADMQKLLAVKNQAMAEAQKSAAAQNETKPAEPAAAQTPTATVAPEAPVKPDAAAAPAEKPAATSDAPAKDSKPQVKPAKPAVNKPAVAAPPPAPVEEPGLFDSLLENPIILAALAAILALFGGWFFMRNRRKSTLDGFEQGILTSGGLKANTVFGNTSGGTVDTGDTSFLTDFSQSSGGMIDTHDVDPIAEAEVYMAYGRDTQAEEILKDAISKEPKRYELHLKLLEILAGRKDTGGFETLAGELYSQLGATDPVWAKVADLGHKLEPSNPLYQANAMASAAAPVAAQSSLEASEFADAEVMTESSLDFSLDAEASTPNAGSGNEQGATDLDFDLGMGDSSPAESVDAVSMTEASTASDVSSDTLSMPEAPANVALDSGATISMDLNEPTAGLDFQLDLPEQAATGNDQLDMADLGTLPSLDMGDIEAAKVDAPMESPTVQLDVADFGNTMPNLEVPTFDLPEATPAADTPVADTKEDQDLETISFDLPEVADDITGNVSLAEAEQTISMDVQDFDKTMMIQPSTVEEISFESATETDQALDLTFGDLETSVGDAQEMPAAPQPALDLTGISLDLGDTAAESAGSPAEPVMVDAAADMTATAGSVQDESEEVNTKLDLVTAYMEIGDNEGARELLDEVMKEGGPKQQARAKEILATIA